MDRVLDDCDDFDDEHEGNKVNNVYPIFKPVNSLSLNHRYSLIRSCALPTFDHIMGLMIEIISLKCSLPFNCPTL